MRSLPLPRRRRYRIALLSAVVLAGYLVLLSGLRWLGGDDRSPVARRTQAQAAVTAENWGLVPVPERDHLSRAIDDAWRGLRSYRMRYTTGLPDQLAGGGFETEATSIFLLDGSGRISAQRDTNFLSAQSPASSGREERFEGFRILSDQRTIGQGGRKINRSELIYQKFGDGVWVCERTEPSPLPPPLPGVNLADSGDAGFREMDGRQVRGFRVALGAFGLRQPATVWIDTESLLLRAMETEGGPQGRHEWWRYSGFDEPATISPPRDVACQDS